MSKPDIQIRDVDPDVKRRFKINCLLATMTFRQAFVWFMREVNAGRITLPTNVPAGKQR